MVNVQQPVLLADGPSLKSILPPAREFLLSAGFGGAAALLAALLLALVVTVAAWRASKRHRTQLADQQRRHEQIREDAEHTAAIVRCEQRFKWVVETAGIEPAASEAATLGLGPELALELLQGLHRDAKHLGDDTLVRAITVYFDQLSRVLAQQGGPLANLHAIASADTNGSATTATANTGHAAVSPSTRTTPTGIGAAESTPDTSAAQPAPSSPEPETPTASARSVNVPGKRRRR